jgi:hypothetical protein
MPHHRRIVLSIETGTSRDTIRQAAQWARLLDLEMHGVFVEDEAVHGMAAYAFAREFRLPTHAWQPINPDRIAEDFRHAANTAKRQLDAVAAATGVRAAFHVLRGDPSGEVAQLLCASDIVVLTEPSLGSEGLTQSFLRSWQSACGSAASVLLLPPGRIRTHGPVAALSFGDRGARTAAHIAGRAGEALLLLGPEKPLVLPPNLTEDRVRRRALTAIAEAALAQALGDPREQVLVLDRDGLSTEQERAVLRVAAARGTPVLLVETPADI